MSLPSRRSALWGLLAVAVAGIVYLMATASTGPADPTEARNMSHGTVVFNSAIIVFREGLEAVLIFAAVTASFRGAMAEHRRPMVAGAMLAFAAAIATWFVAQAALDVASPLGPRLEGITGFLAIIVLLIVLNWFLHKVYWSEWIGKHNRQRKRVLATSTGTGAALGLVLVGFTSVYREGFEVVLFLQTLQLQDGTGTVLEGVGIGLAGTAVVGVLCFYLHAKLPYKRMLILTGVLVGIVLCVMIGGTALTFTELGWLPSAPTPFTLPGWMGSWFEMYSDWTTLGAQVLAGVFVVGSYYAAERAKRLPTRTARDRAADAPQPSAPASAAPAARRELEPVG
jgi:high-affinity iron transporter